MRFSKTIQLLLRSVLVFFLVAPLPISLDLDIPFGPEQAIAQVILPEPNEAPGGDGEECTTEENSDDPNYFDTVVIEWTICETYRHMEGFYGGLLVTVAGVGAIVAAAFGSYQRSYSFIAVAVSTFILPSMVNLWFEPVNCDCFLERIGDSDEYHYVLPLPKRKKGGGNNGDGDTNDRTTGTPDGRAPGVENPGRELPPSELPEVERPNGLPPGEPENGEVAIEFPVQGPPVNALPNPGQGERRLLLRDIPDYRPQFGGREAQRLNSILAEQEDPFFD